ncbi:MAG: Na+/H+ antiporter subunit G [Rubellimicrobium sp.]|nr:Na+/H+ antiporter subunit G [Rubellimicrobium sp.]
MALWQEVIVSIMLVIAGVFGLVGSIGLVKLPEPMMRLHAPTKATTLGVGGALLASMFNALFVLGRFSFHELLISIFLFLTAPITAHFIAKAHLHRHRADYLLPATGTGMPWAEAAPPDGSSAAQTEPVTEPTSTSARR